MSYEVNEKMFREEEDDNDVIELDGSEENISKNDKKGKLKRRRTSNVWSFFDMLPMPPSEKAHAKCKYCSHTFLAPSQYGIGNLKRHMEVCTMRDTRDVGQMLLDQNKKSSSEAQEYPPEATEMIKEFDSYEKDDIYAQKSQLELYLDESRMERSAKLNILTFWKINQFRYPKVSSMASDILSIPVSTVASESTFSIGGHVIDQFRSLLKPDIVKALLCTRDWLYGEQEQTQMTSDELAEDVVAMNNSFESNLDIPISSKACSANIY